MDSGTALRIFVGIFVVVIIRMTLLSYWVWKQRRLAIPCELRNAGFVTDTKLRIFEIAVISAFWLNAAFILAFVVWFVGATRGWWAPYWPL